MVNLSNQSRLTFKFFTWGIIIPDMSGEVIHRHSAIASWNTIVEKRSHAAQLCKFWQPHISINLHTNIVTTYKQLRKGKWIQQCKFQYSQNCKPLWAIWYGKRHVTRYKGLWYEEMERTILESVSQTTTNKKADWQNDLVNSTHTHHCPISLLLWGYVSYHVL